MDETRTNKIRRLGTTKLPIWFRWLGNAGFELSFGGKILTIDPFLSRPGFHRLWIGRVKPNLSQIAKVLPRCDYVLATCARWDHCMDIPPLVLKTGAKVYGTQNVGDLLRCHDIPAPYFHQLQSGDRISLSHFEVEVLPADHGRAPILASFKGSIPTGLKPPLRVRDYRMENRKDCLSFLIGVDDIRLLLVGEQARPADILLLSPHLKAKVLEGLLFEINPKVILPIQWDDIFQPLSKPLRPRRQPRLRRVNLNKFKRSIEKIRSDILVLVPELFGRYNLRHLLTYHSKTNR
jgi:L-ascorbate metabolism protein UlaG (beta-lactamase superfamily)